MREILEKEYNAVQSKLANLEKSLQEEINTRRETENTLKELRESLPEAQVNTALAQLKNGDKSSAIALFDKTIEQAEKNNQLAAKAAYENGRIAESDIRYLDAKAYYLKAVKFQPENSLYNNQVGSILYVLGQHKEAIGYYQLALESDLKNFGEEHPQSRD